MKTIKNTNLDGKRVLLIVDYNTKDIYSSDSYETDNGIPDSTIPVSVFKIDQTLPTIEYIIEKNPKEFFITTHMGRPEEKHSDKKRSCTTQLAYFYLCRHFDIGYARICEWEGRSGNKLKIYFGDNCRYYSQEELTDFYKNFDVIVNDAFGCAHRETRFRGYAGLLMEKEVKALSEFGRDLAIIGGEKREKLKIVDKFRNTFVGGALWKEVKENEKVKTPVDFLLENGEIKKRKEIEGENMSKEKISKENIKDIGPESKKILWEMIDQAKFILFNGALGFGNSTAELTEKLRRCKGRVLIGGGETAAAVMKILGPNFKCGETGICHVSTGGGVLLSYFNGDSLPGVESVEN